MASAVRRAISGTRITDLTYVCVGGARAEATTTIITTATSTSTATTAATATAVFAAAAAMFATSVAGDGRFEAAAALPKGLFDDEAVYLASVSRKTAEHGLRLYGRAAAQKRHALQEEQRAAAAAHNRRAYDAAARALTALDGEMKARVEAMLYPGAQAGERQAYLERHGCAAWTEAALARIRLHAGESGVLELGAGLGHWARALRARGVDVRAFDDMSLLPLGPSRRPDPLLVEPGDVDSVLRGRRGRRRRLQRSGDGATGGAGGDERAGHGGGKVLALHPPPDVHSLHARALLLVFPDPGPMAHDALSAYRGRTLVYVGEARAGCNADDAFFDALESDRWQLEATEELSPFPGNHEKLYVFRRLYPRRWWRLWLW